MSPTKTGLYATYADDKSVLLYWDGEDWVDQDGIRPCYKKVQWTGKPLFVPALRTWVGLTEEEINAVYEQAEVLVHDSWVGNGTVGLMFPIMLYKMFEAKLKEKNT
jgi:hypothetical protein